MGRWTGFAAAGLLAAALAGCGGSGGSGDTAAAAPAAGAGATVAGVTAPTGNSPVTLTALTAEQAAALTPAVTVGGVAITSPPVATFAVSDGATTNNPILGLTTSNVRFALAKLVPGTNGSPSKWVSYIVTSTTAGQAQRPSTDNTGTLVDNKNGTYTYTFARDITKVKDEVAAMTMTAPSVAADLGDLTYDPSLTHRMVIQLSGGGIDNANAVNAVYDFIPATGKAVAATDTQREVVAVASCNECHEKLTLHGSRNDTRYCVVCHTDQRKFGQVRSTSIALAFPALVEKTRVDATTGITSYLYSKNTTTTSSSYHPTGTVPTYVADGATIGDFPNLIHKIHQGGDLVKQNYNYANVVFNYKGFSMLGGGQKMCAKCHDNTKAAQADNWNTKPSRLACGACHDGINFADGTGTTLGGATTGHVGKAQSNDATCALCHGAADIKTYHMTVNKTEHNPTVPDGLVNFTYEIKSAAVDATSKLLTVVFKISADGTPVTTLPPSASFTGSGPGFILAWAETQDGITTPADFNNLGNNRGETASLGFSSMTITGPDSSGYFTAVSKAAAPARFAAGKMRTVGLQSYWSQTLGTESVARHTVSAMKTVTGDTARRQVVDPAKCSNCHEFFEGHGGSRVFSKDSKPDQFVCVLCHNPAKATSGRGIDDATVNTYAAAGRFSAADLKKLTEWGLSTTFPVTVGSNWALNLPVTSNNMKDMIHGIHIGRDRVTPFMDARDRTPSAITLLDFRRMDFPGRINNCETCHIAGTYASVPTAALASTYEFVNTTGNTTTALAKAALAQANAGDIVTSPFAAACSSCHDSVAALSHMSTQGGLIQGTRATFASNVATPGKGEACATCHGVGRAEDVTVKHK